MLGCWLVVQTFLLGVTAFCAALFIVTMYLQNSVTKYGHCPFRVGVHDTAHKETSTKAAEERTGNYAVQALSCEAHVRANGI